MEPEKSFRELIFMLLHDSQHKLRYRMLTSSKRELSKVIYNIHMELLEEYICQALDCSKNQSVAEEDETIVEIEENTDIKNININSGKGEKISLKDRIFGKRLR